MMESSNTTGISEQLANIELDMGNDDDSSGNDFPFGHLMAVELNVENYSLQEDAALELYVIIPTLQEMASFEVAIELWHRVINDANPKRDTCWEYKHGSSKFLNVRDTGKVENLLQHLPVPRPIRELIGEYIEPSRREMNDWLRCHGQEVFSSKLFVVREESIRVSDLMFCYWSPDGRIDYRKTALNMLSNPTLTVTDKFNIMCKYCLEDEIKKLSIDSITDREVGKITFDNNPLMYYWLCRIKGDLDKLPKRNGESIEVYLIFIVNTWSAIEYFWNKLNVNEQISNVEVLLDLRPEFQKQLFSVMNEFQKCYVLSTRSLKIVSNFWRQMSGERWAYLIWLRIVKTMRYDDFEELIFNFLCDSLPDDVEKLKYMVEMWNCAPEDLKNRALKSMTGLVVGLHTDDYCESSCRLEFLLAFLSHGDVEFRKRVMFDKGDALVLINHFSMIDQLIELCLPDANDVTRFKNYVMNSKTVLKHCTWLLGFIDGDFKWLKAFFDHYSPDSDVKVEFVIKMIESWTTDSWFSHSVKRLNLVMKFIDDHLDVVPDQAIKFKKRIVLLFVPKFVEHWFDLYDDELRKFVDAIKDVLDAEDLKNYKINVAGSIQTKCRWSKFDVHKTNSLISWCFDGDDRKIIEFKKSLSIDEIFAYCWGVFKQYPEFEGSLDSISVCEMFAVLDEVLIWYFDDPDDAKKYKLKKVFGWGDSGFSMFRKFAKDKHIDENSARNILPWFFEDDREEIRNFKELYKDNIISKMIDIE